MPKKQQRPPKGRLLEKAARGPQAFQVRYERIISKYVAEVSVLNSEAAQSLRFSQLNQQLKIEPEKQPILETSSDFEFQVEKIPHRAAYKDFLILNIVCGPTSAHDQACRGSA